MEQSVLNGQERRWADAVAKLTAMTYGGQLKWEKVTTNDVGRFVYEGYATSLPNPSLLQSFSLIVKTPKDGAKHQVSFIASHNGVNVKQMDDLTIIQALADAVLSKTENKAGEKEDAVLSAIEGA